MTVADLIAALSQYPPHKPVRVNIDSFVRDTPEGEMVVIGPRQAVDADVVVYEGSHVTIEAR